MTDNGLGSAFEPLSSNDDMANALMGKLKEQAHNYADLLLTPGRVAAGVQPKTSGVMTEEDAYHANQLQDQANKWAHNAMPFALFSQGMAAAPVGSLGAFGGGFNDYVKALSNQTP